MIKTNNSAVSPVVGVMLMLVVTIIVAAIVSGFAGGLGSSTPDVPQAKTTGTYSYSSDIFQLYHAGGDELSTQEIIVKIQQNDDDFGGYGSLFTQMGSTGIGMIIADKSCVSIYLSEYDVAKASDKCWLNQSTGVYPIPVFRPGDTMYYTDSFKKGLSGYKDADGNTDVVGRSLILEVSTTDGQMISKSKVMIDP